MKILLDHCVDRRLKVHLPAHDVTTAREMGWQGYQNGKLLAAAETAGFPVLLTVDKNMAHQQNMTGRRIAIVVLSAVSNRLTDITPLLPALEMLLSTLQPGQIARIEAPAQTNRKSP